MNASVSAIWLNLQDIDRKNIHMPNIQVITVISDVHRSFIQIKTTLTKYCLARWISKLHGSFEIHWVRQYQVNFMGPVGKVN